MYIAEGCLLAAALLCGTRAGDWPTRRRDGCHPGAATDRGPAATPSRRPLEAHGKTVANYCSRNKIQNAVPVGVPQTAQKRTRARAVIGHSLTWRSTLSLLCCSLSLSLARHARRFRSVLSCTVLSPVGIAQTAPALLRAPVGLQPIAAQTVTRQPIGGLALIEVTGRPPITARHDPAPPISERALYGAGQRAAVATRRGL